MTDPLDRPCCSAPSSCCDSPAPAGRGRWKLILFILVLLVGAALAARSVAAKSDAGPAPACCAEPCGE